MLAEKLHDATATIEVPRKLLRLFAKPKRFKIAVGGRGSGKSESFAKVLAGKVEAEGLRILCCREHQNTIEESVHNLIQRQIKTHELPGFDIQSSRINHDSGGGFIYRGLARNPEGVKSIDDVDVAWVEEAQTLSQESIEKFTPSIRAADGEIWFSANPRSSKDPFSQRFLKPFESKLRREGYYEDDLHLIVFLNYCDNPWFPSSLEAERAWDETHAPKAQYRHVWLGEYDDSVERSIILPEWFDACVDAHKKLGWEPRGVKVAAHDPSDEGGDTKGYAYRHGNVFLDVREKLDYDVNDGMDWALGLASDKRPDWFVWDADGMGISLKRQVEAALRDVITDYHLFHGGAKVANPEGWPDEESKSKQRRNKDTYKNRRAQRAAELRDRMSLTYRAVEKSEYHDPDKLVSIASDIADLDLLRAEVCRVPSKPNALGLFQLATKKEMARMGIESPGMFDSLIMSFDQPQPRPKRERIKRDTSWIV